MSNFYLKIAISTNDVENDTPWTHVFKVFHSGKNCGTVEDLGRATDENLESIHKKYPNKAIAPLGGYMNQI